MDYVSQLSHRSIGNLEKLCSLPFENCRIWNKLPCSVEIKTTLKKGIAVHYHQDPELKKRLLYLWELNLSRDVFSESGRCALYDALFHLLSYVDQLNADNNPSGLNSNLLGALQKHWNREYIRPSCESLSWRISLLVSLLRRDYSYSLILEMIKIQSMYQFQNTPIPKSGPSMWMAMVRKYLAERNSKPSNMQKRSSTIWTFLSRNTLPLFMAKICLIMLLNMTSFARCQTQLVFLLRVQGKQGVTRLVLRLLVWRLEGKRRKRHLTRPDSSISNLGGSLENFSHTSSCGS